MVLSLIPVWRKVPWPWLRQRDSHLLFIKANAAPLTTFARLSRSTLHNNIISVDVDSTASQRVPEFPKGLLLRQCIVCMRVWRAQQSINAPLRCVRTNTRAKIDRRILCATDNVTISSEQLPAQPEQLPERPEQLPQQLEQLAEQPNQLPEQPEQHPKKLEQLPDQPKQLQNNAQNNANNTRTTRTTP